MDDNNIKRDEENIKEQKGEELNREKEDAKSVEQNDIKKENVSDDKLQDGDVKNNEESDGEQKEEKSEIEVLNEKLKEADDRYKRLLAEFDNFRKRSEKESAQMIDIGASVILNKILPVVDNFERAIAAVPEDLKENSFVDGIDKIYKQILKIFEEIGVKQISAVGKPFDPNFHNAVLTDENAEGEVDTVVEELQKGYMYKDQVLRHSMVKVKK